MYLIITRMQVQMVWNIRRKRNTADARTLPRLREYIYS